MLESARYFDMLSSIYDKATEVEGSWNPPKLIDERIRDKTTPTSRILDIGIGTGQEIEGIYRSNNYSEIVGVDVSEEMLSICGRKYPKIKLQQISSVDEIGKIDQVFDLIISSGAIEFIKDIDSFFQQCSELLSSNGKIIFTYEPMIEFHSIQSFSRSLTVENVESPLYVEDFYTYRYQPVFIAELLKKHGLSVVNDEEFVSYKKGDESIIYHLVEAERMQV